MSSDLSHKKPDPTRRSVLRGATLALSAPALVTLGATAPAWASSPAADFKGITLKVLANSPHASMYTTVLAPAWKKKTGGTLEVTAVDYASITDRVIQDVTSGKGEFDIFDYYYYGLGAIAEAGALVDLTDWIRARADLHTRDYLPSLYDAYTLHKGRRYGLPYDGDQQLVFYNRELLDAYGLRPPQTWDAYDAIAKVITRGGGGQHYGAVVTGQTDPMVLGCAFINRLVGYGGDLVDRYGRPVLTSPAALAAAQHLVGIAPNALPTPTATGLDASTASFLSGKVALVETWTGIARRADDPTLSEVTGKWGAVAIPRGGANRGRRTPLNGGYGLGVSALSKNRQAALEYIAWATGADEMLLETTRKNSAIDPNRESVLHSGTYATTTPTAYPLIRQGLEGTPLVWPKNASAPANLQQLVEHLASAIEGKQSAVTALRKAQAGWQY
ncbi:ABC transporter substrate-binding protein [Streptomyces sp. NPDC088794]|uniref:ABC transporter substrate-binding protein n=1 Tax=Streptomyces sp. NPDC088794 TaxID=3365902 RepID=UPI0037F88AE0